MKKIVKRIRNLTIGAISLLILGNGIRLVKGEKRANKVINNHKQSENHVSNLVAHRGFSGMYPDNSYTAIDKAIEMPCVNLIEIDVRLTSDNTLVLHHDTSTNIDDLKVSIASLDLTDIEDDLVINDFNLYNLTDLTSDDLLFLYKRYLGKSKTFNLMRLKNLIPFYMEKTDKKLIIDIKTNKVDLTFMEELNKILSNYKDRIYLQTDCYDFLIEMKYKYPDYKYLYIINSSKDLDKMNIDIDGFTIKYSLFDEIKLKENKLYLVYTINSKEKYLDLINSKNYHDNIYIITDNPDYICGLENIKVLEKR